MAINQNSQIKIRSGLQENLPILAKGELGWATDTLRLFIGNGPVEEGAPYTGNTEIATVGNSPTSNNTPVSGTLTGTINGTNNVFTIPYTSTVPHTLIVWKNVPLIPNIGYTVSGATITFVSAPQVGDNLYYNAMIQS